MQVQVEAVLYGGASILATSRLARMSASASTPVLSPMAASSWECRARALLPSADIEPELALQGR